MKFKYMQPTEILFGSGEIQKLPQLIQRYGEKILLVGPQLNEALVPLFEKVELILFQGKIEWISYYEVEPNPSVKTVEKGLAIAKENQVDVILGVGGGSVMDVAKLIGLCFAKTEIDWDSMLNTYSSFEMNYPPIGIKKPVIVVPTTAGTGSQCTQASVITASDGMKGTLFHQDNYATVALIDSNLTETLPRHLVASTAFDAFTHAFEAYLRNEENPWVEQFALQAIEGIVTSLPKVLLNKQREDRERLSLADTQAGIALSNSGACICHPISEVIGSYFNKINHGQALARAYPAFLKWTFQKYERKFARVCRIMDRRYQKVEDRQCAEDFNKVMKQFLVDNELWFDVEVPKEIVQKIRHYPLWEVIPMEDKTIRHQIINEICDELNHQGGKENETH